MADRDDPVWFTELWIGPLLSPLPVPLRERVLAATRPRDFGRDEVVFHEDDPGDSLHLVKSGRLAVRLSLRSGEAFTLAVLSPGDAFGELAVLASSHRRTATVVAWEPSVTLSLSGADFTDLCQQYPAIERLVLSLMTERVDQLSHRLLEALYVDVDGRVRNRLVELCDVYGAGEAGTVIPVTQDDLAGLVGANRTTVNHALQRLSARAVIRLSRGSVEIVDPRALRDGSKPT